MSHGIGGPTDDEYDDIAEINMIPLIDVMLVLLIIFMIAAPLSIGGIKVQLPQSKARGSSLEDEKIILSISKSGRYYLGESQKVSSDSLVQTLKAVFEHRDKKRLYIRGDKSVAYEKVVYAMSAAKLAGVHKMSMLTDSPTR